MSLQLLTPAAVDAYRYAAIAVLNPGGLAYPTVLRLAGLDAGYSAVALADFELPANSFVALDDDKIELDVSGGAPATVAIGTNDIGLGEYLTLTAYDTEGGGPIVPSSQVVVVVVSSASDPSLVAVPDRQVDAGDALTTDHFILTVQPSGENTQIDTRAAAGNLVQILDSTGSTNPAATLQIYDGSDVLLLSVALENPSFIATLLGGMGLSQAVEGYPVAAGYASYCLLLDLDMTPHVRLECLTPDALPQAGLRLSTLDMSPDQIVRISPFALQG